MPERIHVVIVDDDATRLRQNKKLIENSPTATFRVRSFRETTPAQAFLRGAAPDIVLVSLDFGGIPAGGIGVMKSANIPNHTTRILFHPGGVDDEILVDHEEAVDDGWPGAELLLRLEQWVQDHQRRCKITSALVCPHPDVPPEYLILRRRIYVSGPNEHMDERVKLLEKACGSAAEVTATVLDNYTSALQHIRFNIRQANAVVADLGTPDGASVVTNEGLRPNVLMEIGLALAFLRNVVLLLPEGAEVPYNLLDVKTIRYTPPLWNDPAVEEKLRTWWDGLNL